MRSSLEPLLGGRRKEVEVRTPTFPDFDIIPPEGTHNPVFENKHQNFDQQIRSFGQIRRWF